MKKKERYFIIVDCRNWYDFYYGYVYNSNSCKMEYRNLGKFKGENEKEPFELWEYRFNKDESKYLLDLHPAYVLNPPNFENTWNTCGRNTRAWKTFSSLEEAKMHCILEGIECFIGKKCKDANRIKENITFREFCNTFERVF